MSGPVSVAAFITGMPTLGTPRSGLRNAVGGSQ